MSLNKKIFIVIVGLDVCAFQSALIHYDYNDKSVSFTQYFNRHLQLHGLIYVYNNIKVYCLQLIFFCNTKYDVLVLETTIITPSPINHDDHIGYINIFKSQKRYLQTDQFNYEVRLTLTHFFNKPMHNTIIILQ